MTDALATVGYEGAALEDFVAHLEARGIRVLVDVRERPQSRKPGFSKSALAAALQEAGIAYESWRVLGAPRPIRRALRETGDRDAFLRAYAARLNEHEDTVEALGARVRGEAVCLLCFERDASLCHRSVLAERLRGAGYVRVVHHLAVHEDPPDR